MSQRNITSFFKPKDTSSVNLANEIKVRPFKEIKPNSPDGGPAKKRKLDVESEEQKPKATSMIALNEEKIDIISKEYNPGKSRYHPLEDAQWKKDESTPYLALTRTFQLIEETKSRLKMIETLGNLFSSIILLNPDDLLASIYLSINQLAPAYEGLELGVAETTLMKIICETTGRKLDFIKSQTHETGDLGIVAEQSRMAQRMMFKPAPLTISGVFRKLKDIAKAPGKNKITPIKDIYIACRSSEARFFIRSLLGKLRIGIAEQILTTRKRKNVDIDEIKVQVCVYAFDLLYLNGEPLVSKPFAERRKLLKEHFLEQEGVWKFATAMDTTDVDEVQQFLEESIKGNCEGLMVKTLEIDATYEIARRSRNWLKLKKDYLSGCGDSLDLVVIGGYRGKGKRTGSYGGYLLACYDQDNEEYQSICKIGTGFSDEDLQTHAEFFKNYILPAKKSYVCCDSTLEPDDWFEPVQVWEIKCADLSLSPIHKAAAGIVDPERGISLRFPRFIRIRDDKSAETSTTAQQVAYMYGSQDQIKNQQNRNNNIEDDFY
uniref:DNA ligase 1 n=1 Tax=Glossina brevipalpis TaxID=37001 RepID=A0A1A9VZR1_9MUSC